MPLYTLDWLDLTNKSNTKCWWRCKAFHRADWHAKWYRQFGKSLAVFYKLKQSLLAITSTHKEMKMYVYAKNCPQMFMVVICIIAKNWNQLNVQQLMTEQIVHLHKECHWSIKKQTTNIPKNMEKLQKHYAKSKRHKRLHTIWFYLHNILKRNNHKYKKKTDEPLPEGGDKERRLGGSLVV